MKALLLSLLFFITSLAYSQCITVPVTATDGSATEYLYFGLDTTATDGIDASLGESERPPLPPSGAFDVRFVGTSLGEGVLKDLRQGSVSTVSRVHNVKFQSSNSPITFTLSLPVTVTVRVQDVLTGSLIDTVLTNTNNTYAVNVAYNQLKFTVNYSLLRSDINQDGIVDSEDLTLIYNWTVQHPDEYNCLYDVNYDGVVDSEDIVIVYNDSL